MKSFGCMAFGKGCGGTVVNGVCDTCGAVADDETVPVRSSGQPIDLLDALANSLGVRREDLPPEAPRDRRSTREIEQDERRIDRWIATHEDY